LADFLSDQFGSLKPGLEIGLGSEGAAVFKLENLQTSKGILRLKLKINKYCAIKMCPGCHCVFFRYVFVSL